MTKGDLYKTPTNQHRFVLGKTPTGDVAFATRGEHPNPDYNHCQLQPPDKFLQESSLARKESTEETARVMEKFANYISANRVA